MQLGRKAAGALAVATLAATLLLSSVVAQASDQAAQAAVPVLAAAAPGEAADGDRTLTVDNTDDLAANGAVITVAGTGFDTDQGLYLAVCAEGIKKNQPLTNCVGGSVPDRNATGSWTRIGDDGQVEWGDDGSFSVSLTLSAAAGDSVDCNEVQCAVYARSDAQRPNQRADDLVVPVNFVAPPEQQTSSTRTTSTKTTATTTASSTQQTSTEESTTDEPTTEETTTEETTTSITTPASAEVDSVKETSIDIGKQQTVVFSGFLAGEDVQLTLYSEPTPLPNQKADEDGRVEVNFDVTDVLAPGSHSLLAIGLTSRNTATASFVVAALPVTSESASSAPSSTAASTTAASTTAASTTATSESSVEPTTEEPTTSASATNSAVTSVTETSAAPGPVATDNSSKALWWLLAGVLVVLVIGGVVLWVTLARRREDLREEARQQREIELAEAAALQQAAAENTQVMQQAEGPRTYQTPRGAEHGLLSGHDDGPALYLGQEPDDHTQVFPTGSDQPTSRIQAPAEHEENYGLFTHSGDVDPEPPTTAMPSGQPTTALPTEPPTTPVTHDAGPGTSQWVPEFDDDEDDEVPPVPPAPPGTWVAPPPRDPNTP